VNGKKIFFYAAWYNGGGNVWWGEMYTFQTLSLFMFTYLSFNIKKTHIRRKVEKRWVRTHKYNEINDSEWLVNQRHAKTKHIFGKYVCRRHLYTPY
jgi:hypothetical protein